MHYAIHKLHWSPSVLDEWMDADTRVKAFYYASTEIKIKRDKEEAASIKRSGRQKR